MKVYGLPKGVNSWDKGHDELSQYFLFDSPVDIKMEQFSYNGKLYSCCSINHKKGMGCVREFKLDQDPEDICEDDVTCPFCNYQYGDSWEMADGGNDECDNCGSIFSYERNVSVSYSMTPVKCNENIKELS